MVNTERRGANGGRFQNNESNPKEEKGQNYRQHQHHRQQSPLRQPSSQRRRSFPLHNLPKTTTTTTITTTSSAAAASDGARYRHSLNPTRRYVKLHSKSIQPR
ncbi:hypothetical protein Vadar_025193 [Vaccinium darrowii]|uniref:Uncharacterized protein n=1 Tax=Vaccinium darrowii TaxID=229202 RepID=A0ACB7XTT0_9ERIC|nr:hypothetical protein Vadar_025193 [Vaccinium darrowii]